MSNKAINDCSVITEEDVDGFVKAFYERKPLSPKTQQAIKNSENKALKSIQNRKR